MLFRLAHFSDPHLGPMPLGDVFRDFALKRLVGAGSWHFRRRGQHDAAIADTLRKDILAQAPDHVACTGDLINIASYREFPRALNWLNGFGDGDFVSLCPGNHDAYVKIDAARGLDLFSAYMTGGRDGAFPYLRLKRNVAIIGLNSALPRGIGKASGVLGDRQLNTLATMLEDMGARGFCRVVLIHHPPLAGLAPPRKALQDATALTDVLKSKGVELVLHGHNHEAMHNEFAVMKGTAHVFGVPSASMRRGQKHGAAAWNLYAISRSKGAWQIEVQTRELAHGGGFAEIANKSFSCGAGATA
jgi:3',5'-cyclic AMP phosphodiesterase CpdA